MTGVVSGDQVQLFSDSSCSTSLSTKTTVTDNTVDITANAAIPQSYTIYAKRWNSEGNTSKCSSHIPYYVMKLSQIWIGYDHTCVLSASGSVKCWGRGEHGRLGNDSSSDKDYPVNVVASNGSSNHLLDIIQVSAGESHSCALTSGGNVKCWGKGEYGRLGNDSTNNKDHPVNVVDGDNSTNDLSNIIQIEAGYAHTCALTSSGNVKCWGRNHYGQLGNGNDEFKGVDHPVSVISTQNSDTLLSNIVQIGTGEYHTCALNSFGNVKCWGYGSLGQLGNDDTSDKNDPVTVVDGNDSTTPLSGIVQITTGEYHTCALTFSGNVKCWGYGNGGRLGNPYGSDITDNPIIVGTMNNDDNTILPLSDIVQISAGDMHTCALTSSGNIKCWGRGDNGRLGNNSDKWRNIAPSNVVETNGSSNLLSNIVQIGSGNSHTCALTSSGTIKCWGKNDYGQLGRGDNNTSNKNYPVTVVDGNGSTTPLQIGSRKVQYNCNQNICSINSSSLISLDLQTPVTSPDTNATPTIRVYHAQAGDVVSLHTDTACSTSSLASGTVAQNSTTIDLTTSALTSGQKNIFYAKVGNVCSSNGISYTYNAGTSN